MGRRGNDRALSWAAELGRIALLVWFLLGVCTLLDSSAAFCWPRSFLLSSHCSYLSYAELLT